MTIQWPSIAAGLVVTVRALPGWTHVETTYGPSFSSATKKDFCTVGYATNGDAGTYVTTQTPDGFQRLETGRIVGELTCQTGKVDLAGMRDRVFALMNAFDVYVRNTRTLEGLLSQEGTCDVSADVASLSNPKTGTAQSLIWALNYTTVT
jgi:hypothetical protein